MLFIILLILAFDIFATSLSLCSNSTQAITNTELFVFNMLIVLVYLVGDLYQYNTKEHIKKTLKNTFILIIVNIFIAIFFHFFVKITIFHENINHIEKIKTTKSILNTYKINNKYIIEDKRKLYKNHLIAGFKVNGIVVPYSLRGIEK